MATTTGNNTMNEQLQNELEEQARLLGMSAERECDLLEKLDRERALADRLADALISTDAIIRKEVSLVGQWDSPVIFKEALTAWKEARGE